jgi:hypothetical protein
MYAVDTYVHLRQRLITRGLEWGQLYSGKKIEEVYNMLLGPNYILNWFFIKIKTNCSILPLKNLKYYKHFDQ